MSAKGANNPEAYSLELAQNQITVSAVAEAGLFYGAQTVLRLLEDEVLPLGVISDSPLLAIRGFKAYLPASGEEGKKIFRQMVDFLARYKYNYLMLEVGGAMEFKRHPEINSGWIEYCKFMNEYSGKPQEIQNSFPWNKNSIHSTNGGGGFLLQQEVRELLDYCRQNFIEVIPEMPSLSHCDYLLTRHPELAERPEDPYPDTVCPNHPDYYPLLFDLFDEVIDVFAPRKMHIGHDEYYSIGLCPRCHGQKAYDIYAADLHKCSEFLAARGIETIIWAEKLLDAHYPNGYPIGGAETRVWHHPESAERTPATHPAIELLPPGMIMMHWYWGIDRSLERAFVERKLPMLFGNCPARGVPEWRRRRQYPDLLGVFCSNWGATDMKTLQRNGMLFDLVFGSAMQWNGKLDSDDYPMVRDWTLGELYHTRKIWEKAAELFEITHYCQVKKEYRSFVDGIFVDEAIDLLGHHLIRSTSGKILELPVIYGSNISSCEAKFERGENNPKVNNNDTYPFDMRIIEASYSTLPFQLPDGKTAYRTIYPLPPGERFAEYLEFRPAGQEGASVQKVDFF